MGMTTKFQGEWPYHRATTVSWDKGQLLLWVTAPQVSRWHPPEVRAGMSRLAVARETHRAACSAAWASFLRGEVVGEQGERARRGGA
jgi:hypothetical protein